MEADTQETLISSLQDVKREVVELQRLSKEQGEELAAVRVELQATKEEQRKAQTEMRAEIDALRKLLEFTHNKLYIGTSGC